MRIFLEIILMIIFRRIERAGRDDLGHDGFVKFTGLAKFFFGLFRDPFLLLVMIKDRAAVLGSLVGKLAV